MAVRGPGTTGDVHVEHVDAHIAAAAPLGKPLPMPDINADGLQTTTTDTPTTTTNTIYNGYLNTPPATPDPILLSPISSKQSRQKTTLLLPLQPSTMATVNQTTMACARCKQKKIKCDGKQPSCSACTRAKVTCAVPDIISQAGLARGHVEKLENRISELQSLIDTKTRELKEIQNRQGSFSSYYTNSPISSNPFTPGKRSSATSIPRSALSQTPTLLHQEDHSHGDLSLARLLVQTLRLKDHGPCISKLSHLVANERSTAFESINAAERLPLEQNGKILLDSYLDNEQRCFPFLSRRKIICLYNEIYSGSSEFNQKNIQDYFCLYMIFAIACLSHPPGIEDPQTNALRFYKAALICREQLPRGSTLSIVQSILLLCLFSMNGKVSQDAWRLSRRALHISIEGEFHLSRRSKSQNLENETTVTRIQRRAFWSAYCLNRITSNLIYDRPPSIPEASIDVEMPLDFELDVSNIGALAVSLLPCLTSLYGISTSAFTSFNSLDPPSDDMAVQLRTRMEQITACSTRLFELLQTAFPDKIQGDSLRDIDWVPPYVTISFNSHAMLMHQWAIAAIAAKYDGVPQQIKNKAIKHCIETIRFIGQESPILGPREQESLAPKFGHLRIAFIIMLRSLVIMLSTLLVNEYNFLAVMLEDNDGLEPEDIDQAICIGIRFLKDTGPRQGQSCAFLPALVLALRYAVYERGFGKPPKIPFSRPEEQYRMIEKGMEENYPRLLQLASSMNVSSMPISIGLRRLEEEIEANTPPMNAFKEFGDSAGELEELARVVRWRLKVQYGVGNARDSLRAFEERMGADRVMETGDMGFSGLAGFNAHQEIGGDSMHHYGPNFIQDFPNPGRGGVGAGLKMDVDFSGFETDIITFE
ncbi:hypothetical protein TWF788_001891 [Orbilia oligospora]|uniref:Uncharacterized protein n=2 Tax=Orbilia oligospora TaxID=2813651 RepID=A0A6G1MF60_ORBOL|nr:hypothetical protein TWF788_001891 [Orbilia oligospora]KAF3256469.1 hypothetical protein TWF192_001893 [Orbilia oligospora]